MYIDIILVVPSSCWCCINGEHLVDDNVVGNTGVEPEPFELGEHLVTASDKLVVVDQLLAYLRPLGHKVLLFSQMTRVLDILQDYLGYRGAFPSTVFASVVVI